MTEELTRPCDVRIDAGEYGGFVVYDLSAARVGEGYRMANVLFAGDLPALTGFLHDHFGPWEGKHRRPTMHERMQERLNEREKAEDMATTAQAFARPVETVLNPDDRYCYFIRAERGKDLQLTRMMTPAEFEALEDWQKDISDCTRCMTYEEWLESRP